MLNLCPVKARVTYEPTVCDNLYSPAYAAALVTFVHPDEYTKAAFSSSYITVFEIDVAVIVGKLVGVFEASVGIAVGVLVAASVGTVVEVGERDGDTEIFAVWFTGSTITYPFVKSRLHAVPVG